MPFERRPAWMSLCIVTWMLLSASVTVTVAAERRIDHRYSPPWWQTLICLVDDDEKTLVGSDGSLLYDFPGPYFHPLTLSGFQFSGFQTQIIPGLVEPAEQTDQSLHSPRVPIVVTRRRCGPVEVVEEAFALPQLGAEQVGSDEADAHYDLLVRTFHNTADESVTVTPSLLIKTEQPTDTATGETAICIGPRTRLISPTPFRTSRPDADSLRLTGEPIKLAGGEEVTVTTAVARGDRPEQIRWPASWTDATALRRRAIDYWQNVDLPWDRIIVGDDGIQGLLDASIRHLYQLRDTSRGYPMTLGGPTCYRSLWIVDAAFAANALDYLGEPDTAAQTLDALLERQNEDGGFMLIGGHWKETGIMLWAVTQHARLTGDRRWLADRWPKMQRAFQSVRRARAATQDDPEAPNYRLLPAGFSDGGLGGQYLEYTNVYWTLAGMRAAVDAAEWMDKPDQASEWRAEYNDFLATFRRAARRDMQTDPRGFEYLHVRMNDDENVAPQKAQWAFLHAVFPGKVFPPDEPVVAGNLAMLEANECQGLVRGTGWMDDGIWTYFGSFLAHAYLWNGDGRRAADLLYAFGNHTSPLLAWREEQDVKGEGDVVWGDMPHDWGNSEIVRLVRHLLVLEREDELHLCEGLPLEWLRPSTTTALPAMPTEFGPVSLSLQTSKDGSEVLLSFHPPAADDSAGNTAAASTGSSETRPSPSTGHARPRRIVLHLDGWSQREGTVELSLDALTRQSIQVRSNSGGSSP